MSDATESIQAYNISTSDALTTLRTKNRGMCPPLAYGFLYCIGGFLHLKLGFYMALTNYHRLNVGDH